MNANSNVPSRRRPYLLVVILVGLLPAVCVGYWQRNVVLAALFGPGKATLHEAYPSRPDGPKLDHGAFDALLKKYVTADGRVDYVGLKKASAKLDAYLKTVAAAPPLESLDRNEALALLINAYNAGTLRLILDYWPIKSIKDIPGSKRWNDPRWKIGPLTLSLSRIESDYLRPKFIEPRMHFAINCASLGCPPLRAEAYTAAKLDQQLDEQARYVHTHDRWLRFDPHRNRLYLTQIYNWYGGDFKQVAGSVEAHAAKFNPDLKRHLDSGKSVTLRWLDYDWSINAAQR